MAPLPFERNGRDVGFVSHGGGDVEETFHRVTLFCPICSNKQQFPLTHIPLADDELLAMLVVDKHNDTGTDYFTTRTVGIYPDLKIVFVGGRQFIPERIFKLRVTEEEKRDFKYGYVGIRPDNILSQVKCFHCNNEMIYFHSEKIKVDKLKK